MLTAPVRPVTSTEEFHYELAPLLQLPEVDLSVSIKSRLIRSRRIHGIIRAIARSPLTFLGYFVYLGIGLAVFFVPARIGRLLSPIGVLVGLPGTVIPLGNLRFDIVQLLLSTYDTWFFVGVSTVVSVLIGVMLDDTRAPIVLLTWLSLMINIGVDASVLGLRQIWIANTVSVVCSVAIAAAVSLEVTDGLNALQLVRVNRHTLSAASVVRDGLLTMNILVVRNILRKYTQAIKDTKVATTSTLCQCVSFRCRLQLRGVSDVIPLLPAASSVSTDASSAKSKLRYASDIGYIDARDTVLGMPWLWRARPNEVLRSAISLHWIGIVGFVVNSIIYLVNVAWPGKYEDHIQLPIVIVAATASTVFVGITTASMQRLLLRAVATSFDFHFVAVEIAIVHFALADILGWKLTTVVALFFNFQWCVWILCWDAITPLVRRRLGLSRRFAAFIGLCVIAGVALVAVIIFIFRPPDGIQDRVLCRIDVFNHVVEFRSLTWYFSCVMTISLWALRLIWRLLWASESELVVLDGTVEYDIRRHPRTEVDKWNRQRVAQMRSQRNPSISTVPVIPLNG